MRIRRRNSVTVIGPADATTLVLAHGFGCDQNMWRLVAPALAQRYALRAGQCLDLDLSDLEFCDSTGTTVLPAARQYAGAADAGIVLTGVPPHLLRVLTMVGLDRVFTLRPAPDSPPAGTAAG
ncbi:MULTISPECIES: STAS domain-containing protein [unclassified Streptomyces]|uniref:STAS domain-containing protein n=1 Tax=unclassified Streptomyces TaxID=2593676 RepID=UPI0036ADA797